MTSVRWAVEDKAARLHGLGQLQISDVSAPLQ